MDKKMPRLFFLGIIALLLVLSYFIVRPFIISLISALVLAYLIRPVHVLFLKKMKKTLAALLCTLILLALIVLPFTIMINTLVKQIISATTSGSSAMIIEKISSWDVLALLHIDLSSIQHYLSSVLLPLVTHTLSLLPSLIINLLLTFLGVFYMLLNWESLSSNLSSYLPFREKDAVAKEIAQTTSHIMYGYVLVALLEFCIALIGFWIAGVDYFLLFPFLIAILAFIPMLGPGLIWVPLAIYYAATGSLASSIIIIITGLIISVGIEHIVSPKIIGDKAKIHPFILLLGILGGVPLFGIFGFIVGPLILVYTLKIMREAMKEVS